MPFFETRQHRARREAEQRREYPEFEIATPDEIGEADSFSRQRGGNVTGFTEDAENTFLTNFSDPDEELGAARPSVTAQSVFESQIRESEPITQHSPRDIQAFRNRTGLNDRDGLNIPFRNTIGDAFDTVQGIGEVLGSALNIGSGRSGPTPAATPFSVPLTEEFTPTIERAPEAPQLGGALEDLEALVRPGDTVTGLPIRTAIRQGSQTLTDPVGAFREQFELENQGGIGFGLEGSAPFEQLRRVPGIERDIPGTEISPFDVTLGLSDALLDIGGVAALSGGARSLIRGTAIRSVLPSVSDDAFQAAIAGGSAPSRVSPDIAATIARGPAAQNAAEAAERSGTSVGSEVLRTLDAADVMVQQDKPGVIGDLLNQVPGLRELRAFDQPRFEMPDDILESAVGRQMAMGEFHTTALPTREQAYRTLDNVFGEGAAEGIPARRVTFLGEDDGYPAIGTVYDIFQRPDLYDLTDAQRAAIRQIDTRNLDLRTLANTGYGTEIGEFVAARPGAAYLPNVDASDAARELQEISAAQTTRSISGTRSKPRVFDTGHERWVNDNARVTRGELTPDQVFVPETDIRQLLTSLDAQKANAVGTAVWREGLPGRTLVEVKESVAPRLVEARQQLTGRISSLRAKIQRAEQSIRRDSATTRVLDRQISDNDARITALINQTERVEDGLPELDALRGVIDELELRQAALNQAVSGPAANTSRQSLRVTDLREELADVLDEYNEIRRAYNAVNLRGEQFVADGIYRYFPAEQATELQNFSRVTSHRVFELMARANATVLSGDFSPAFGIQGQLAFLLRPANTTIKMFGAAKDPTAPFRLGRLVDDIAADPEGWQRFSFWMGRPVAGTQAVPDELAGGFLGKIPGFNTVNEGAYRVALRQMKDNFDFFSSRAIADGARPDEARAAAADLVSKVFPTINPSRLGQSAAQATTQRAPFTSIAFLRQPAALVAEATKALVKTGLRRPLTLREEFAREAVLRIVGTSVTTISVFSYIDAQIKDIDASEHIERNLKAARVPIPGTEFNLPIGAPFRGVYNAVRPQKVDVAGVGEMWLPFVGIQQFFENRIAPAIDTQLDIFVREEDFEGNKIVKSDFPLNILEALAYERNAIAPITSQGIVDNVIEGESPRVIAAEAAGDFLGGALTTSPEFVQERETKDSIARQGEWTYRGETFSVNSFDELSERVGSVVADQLIEQRAGTSDSGERLSGLQQEQADEAREEATGSDDADQAFALLDAIGQERFKWAMDRQGELDRGEITLEEARGLEKEANWGGQIAGVIRSFDPVFEDTEPLPREQLSQLTDVNEVRAQYFALLQANIDERTLKPTDEFYDDIEPLFIDAIGEAMWDKVQDNIGTRNRAPWQLELRDIRMGLSDTGFWDLRDNAWAEFKFPEATRFDSYFDWRAAKKKELAAEFAPSVPFSTVDRATKKAVDAEPITKAYEEILDSLENPWVAQNSALADRAIRAGYFTATDPQIQVIQFNLR